MNNVMSCVLAVSVAVLVFCQDPPPPTPTLVPVSGATTSATQTLQLQEFARDNSYLLSQTTVYTTTIGGATWALERRITYGEAAVVIVVLALVLVQAFFLTYTVVARRP